MEGEAGYLNHMFGLVRDGAAWDKEQYHKESTDGWYMDRYGDLNGNGKEDHILQIFSFCLGALLVHCVCACSRNTLFTKTRSEALIEPIYTQEVYCEQLFGPGVSCPLILKHSKCR